MFNNQIINAAIILRIGDKNGEVFKLGDTAMRNGLGSRRLEQTAQRMRAIGWLKSGLGPYGGYTITDEGIKLTMFDLINEFTEDRHEWVVPFLHDMASVKPADLAKAYMEDKGFMRRVG